MNFYMAPSDEREFLDFVLQTGDVWIVLYTSPTRRPQLTRELPRRRGDPFWDAVSLLNKDISSKVAMQHVPAGGYYRTDESRSSVIEFSRSRRRAGGLSHGRLWADLSYYDSRKKVLVPKEPEFGPWYDTVAGWIRKHYERQCPLFYAGPGALDLRRKGVKFE